MKKLGWKRWAVVLAFLLVVFFTGYFSLRTVRRAVYWHAHRDETIRPWMSVGYIAHSHRVPPSVLYQALGLPQKARDKRPIRQIAREQNRSIEDVIETLQTAIASSRPPNSPPPPPLLRDEGRSP